MVCILPKRNPFAIVGRGKHHLPLELALTGCNIKPERLPPGFEPGAYFALFNRNEGKPYLLALSEQYDLKTDKRPTIFFAAVSYSEPITRDVLKRFEDETHIKIDRNVPKALARYWSYTAIGALDIFMKDPVEGMNVLAGCKWK